MIKRLIQNNKFIHQNRIQLENEAVRGRDLWVGGSNKYNVEDHINKPIITYHYQDPVIRMSCDYLFNLQEFLLVNNNLEEFTRYTYDDLSDLMIIIFCYMAYEDTKKGLLEYTKIIKPTDDEYTTRLINLSTKINPQLSSLKKEGQGQQNCQFGKGKTLCCSSLNKTQQLLDMINFINGTRISHIDVPTIIDSLTGGATDYQHIGVNIKDTDDTEKIKETIEFKFKRECLSFMDNEAKKVQLLTYFDMIESLLENVIKKSGRAEGILPVDPGETDRNIKFNSSKIERIPYPKIYLFEFFNDLNEYWQIRCETFHLARSPCVHNGLRGYNVFKWICNLWNLDPINYGSNVLIHSIAHAEDRIFGNHPGIYIDTKILTMQDSHIHIISDLDKLGLQGEKGIDLWTKANKILKNGWWHYFNEEYGYDSKGNATRECSDLKEIYRCKPNLEDYINHNPTLKETSFAQNHKYKRLFIKKWIEEGKDRDNLTYDERKNLLNNTECNIPTLGKQCLIYDADGISPNWGECSTNNTIPKKKCEVEVKYFN